jgi:hypothetical protein
MSAEYRRQRRLHSVPKKLPEHENNANSPWAYTNFQGMRLAQMMTWYRPMWFTVPERYILVTLYGALVKDSDVIDKRVTQEALAARCGVSLITVKRAYKKFLLYGLIEPMDEEAWHYTLRVPVRELDEKVHIILEHIDWP